MKTKKMDKSDFKKKVETEEDFIKSRKYSNSLKKLLENNLNPLKDPTIARSLVLTEEELKILYQEAVELLRKEMADLGTNQLVARPGRPKS